jgi:CRP-like cAMP-binding protein
VQSLALVRTRAGLNGGIEWRTAQECLVNQGTSTNVVFMLLDGSVSTHVLESWRMEGQDEQSDSSSDYSSDYSSDEERDTVRTNADFLRRSPSLSSRTPTLKRLQSTTGSVKTGDGEEGGASGPNVIDEYGECVTVLFANDVLGEMALGEDEKHTMSAVTREPTEALLLPVTALRAAVEERPFPIELDRVRRLLAKPSADRREDELRELLPLLDYCPYMASLAPHVRLAVCRALEYKQLLPGVLLIKAGQKPTAMALILSGELAVHQTKTAMGDEEEAVLNELGMDLRAPEDWRWWGDCQSFVLPGICVNEVSISQGYGQLCPTTTTALVRPSPSRHTRIEPPSRPRCGVLHQTNLTPRWARGACRARWG